MGVPGRDHLGFSARWLPVFLGLENPYPRMLTTALLFNLAAAGIALAGWWLAATALFMVGAVLAAAALRVFRRSVRAPKTVGVHRTFPAFVRVAYLWLLGSRELSGTLSYFAVEWGGEEGVPISR